MKKSKWLSLLAIALCINIFFIFPGCSTSDDNGTDYQRYELTVIVSEGVDGTPATGTYTHEEGDVVSFSYSLKPNYTNLVVTLDNETVEPSGTVTITGVHSLSAKADPDYDITGSWSMEEEYDDGSSFSVTLTFVGNRESGTVTDSDGGEGTYTVDEYNNIEFNLVFPDVTYEYEGDFADANNMDGDSERIIGSDSYLGTWIASRNITAIGKHSPASRKDKNRKYVQK